MEVIKTIKVKLYKPTKVKQQFLELMRQNAELLNHYVDVMQKHNTTSKCKLHALTYGQLRHDSKLPSAILQSARDKAIEAYRSYLRRKHSKRKASPPHFSSAPVRLDARTLSIIETDNKLKYMAAITTQSGRIFVPLLGQRYQYKYIAKLKRNELRQGTAELLKQGDDFYLYIAVKKEADVSASTNACTPIGIDLGLRNLSTSVILGESGAAGVKFFSGREALARRNHFAEFRASLGKAKKMRRIKAAKGKESRYMRDLNHKVSSAIIQQAQTAKNPVLVMEDLKYIRQRLSKGRKLNRMLHNWNFSQLQQFIEYKANWLGIPVEYVSPKYTSQRCSRCGFTAKTNRVKSTFRCNKCGYGLNADMNAAVNIAQNFLAGYTLARMGDVAAPLTAAVIDCGSPRL